jgi:hypothetical protein
MGYFGLFIDTNIQVCQHPGVFHIYAKYMPKYMLKTDAANPLIAAFTPK